MILLRQETKDGVVVDYKGNYLWVVFDQACHSEGKCNTGCGGCGGNRPPLKKRIRLNQPLTIKTGQKISLEMHILNENIAAILVFGIPVFLALSCVMLWYIYTPQKIESPLALLSTAIAFAAGFLFVWIIDTIFSRMFPPAVLIPSISNSNLLPEQEQTA